MPKSPFKDTKPAVKRSPLVCGDSVEMALTSPSNLGKWPKTLILKLSPMPNGESV